MQKTGELLGVESPHICCQKLSRETVSLWDTMSLTPPGAHGPLSCITGVTGGSGHVLRASQNAPFLFLLQLLLPSLAQTDGVRDSAGVIMLRILR